MEKKSHYVFLEIGVYIIKPLLAIVLQCSNLGLEEAESLSGWCRGTVLSTRQVVPTEEGLETVVRHCWRAVSTSASAVPRLYLRRGFEYPGLSTRAAYPACVDSDDL